MMLRDITVLLTGAGAPGAPSIIKCLRKNGERNIRIVGVDMNEKAAARSLVDVFYTVPAAEDEGFVDRVLDICRSERVQIVNSIITRELEVLSAAKSRFEAENIKVTVMDPKPLHIVNNKGLLLTAMKESGLPVPEFRIVHTADEAEEAIEKLGYPQKPVVVKTTFGNGSRGTAILNSEVSLSELFFYNKPGSLFMSKRNLMEILREKPNIPEMMVMEYLPGADYTVDLIASQGKVINAVCRRATHVMHSNIFGSVSEQNQTAIKLCTDVVSALGLDGSVNFDLKENCENQPRIMEINPRLGGAVVACALAGVNFPYLRIKQLLGESIPELKPVDGVVMQRRNAEVFFDPNGKEISW